MKDAGFIWHNRRKGPARFVFLVTAALCLAPVSALATSTNAQCLRCHAMSTLALRMPTGEVESLSVNPSEFASSEHRKMQCTQCHGQAYLSYPHPAAVKRIHCLDCHKRQEAGLALFVKIGREFHKSVHYRRHPDRFDCFACHDPHTFRRWRDVTRKSIAERNQICLRCHASSEQFARITERRPMPNLEAAHAWLPHFDLHIQHVRCLDCHTGGDSRWSSHDILPARQAIRDCVKCHSTNSLLKRKLYRYQRQQETARLGFVNSLIINDAYVVGATRNRFLDWAAGALVAMSAIGVGAHAAARGVLRRHASNEHVKRDGQP